MKKIILVLSLLIPAFINASEIKNMFIDSEVDISGNLIVKEIIPLNEYDEEINIYYGNDVGSSLYKSSGIILNSVGKLDSNYDLSKFYESTFEKDYSKEIDNYTTHDDGEYLYIKFNEKGSYFVSYTILNLCAKHNDSSELYFKYLNNFNYDVGEIVITTRLPIVSELLMPWAHGNIDAKVTLDKTASVVVSKLYNTTKNDNYDLRLLFDKDIFSVSINKDKITNNNMIEIIEKQEENNKNMFFIVIGILLLVFIILVLYSHLKIDITKYNIKNKKIDKNLKLLILSDLHDRNINSRILKIINKENPDYIIMSGDMIDGNINTVNIFIDLCKKLEDRNVYYTYGNHEYFLSNEELRKYNKLLKETNINILNNDNVNLSKNICLNGFVCELEYYKRNKNKITNEYINSKLGKIDNKKYNIIVSHNPLVCEDYQKYGFDLGISGHVHGGIIRLPFIGGLLSPEFRFFPEYDSGLYDVDGMHEVVSRGLGFSKGVPFRINNPGEIVIVNLEKEDR